MIIRVSTGSLLFVLVIFPPNGPLAAWLGGSTDSVTHRPKDASTANQTNNDASATSISSFNKTGIVLEDGRTPGTGEERTDPNDKDFSDSNEGIEQKDSTKSSTRNSTTRDTDMISASTREVDTNAAVLVTLSLLKQQDQETSYVESTRAAVQDLDSISQGLHTGYSSIKLDRPSASFKIKGTDWTTSSRVYTGSSIKSVNQSKDRPSSNEGTPSSKETAGMVEEASTMADPAGKIKRTGPRYHFLSDTPSGSIDPATTPDFKTEVELDHTFGTTAGDHVTQTDDVRNWRRDVNATQWEVTKAEFVYKSLWDDAGTEDEEGKKEALEGGIKREGTAREAPVQEGTGKGVQGNKGEDGRFTLPAELRRARNRNEHFSMSFHGLPWREELNILIPVLCGMFGAMFLVLAAYFLRNCPSNIRRMARRSRPSERHRRKSDLTLLIDNSSGDEHP